MWEPAKNTTKLYILGGIVALTLSIHYGWLVEPIFGHVHWIHAIHGRFCYIPIVVGAAWFGIRGGILTALTISLAVLPYIFSSGLETHELVDEFVEIIFYFAIALLAGGLIQRELKTRKKAEDMRVQLERSQKMSLVGQIAAGMAHEIKNPLASIKGAFEILSDKSTSKDERDEFTTIVQKEIKRINTSVSDFLEFARPSQTKMTELDISEIVKSTIKQLQPQAGKRNIEITCRTENEIEIMGDMEKLRQVMLNLLINAIDASPESSTIEVELTENERTISLTVWDSGQGIPQENIDKVFEPFFTTKSSGTGLGLAIAGNIIARHKGTLALKNNDNGGTTAEIVLPKLYTGARHESSAG